jgi:hypothetical protein
MPPRQTSLLSYREIGIDGTRMTCERRVYLFIVSNPKCSDREISEATGLRINNVTARRNELCGSFLVEDAGKKVDLATNKLVMCWRMRA